MQKSFKIVNLLNQSGLVNLSNAMLVEIKLQNGIGSDKSVSSIGNSTDSGNMIAHRLRQYGHWR